MSSLVLPTPSPSEIYYDYPDMAADQWEWLKADLEAANKNRTEAPWIIVNAHRPLYCSCDDDCDESASTMRVGILQSDGTRLVRAWSLSVLYSPVPAMLYAPIPPSTCHVQSQPRTSPPPCAPTYTP